MNQTSLVVLTSPQCKNCKGILLENQAFCNTCGAKIIRERITVKNLVSDFTNNVFGWDNKFFVTVKTLVTKPQILFKEYINGTRKKYMNPFTFLALGTALALFIFNFFAEDYMALNVDSNKQSVEVIASMMEKQMGEDFDAVTYKKEQLEMITNVSSFMLKYFNLLVILFLPCYTFLAFLTYRKPYNYGEHLVINSYIQGLSFLVTSIIFTISVFTNPSVYMLTIGLLILYYTYAYGKLHQLTFAESILKLFKFFVILIASFFIIMILSFILGIAIAFLNH